MQILPNNEPAEEELELEGNDLLEASVVLEGALRAVPEDVYQEEDDVPEDIPDIVKEQI